MGREGMVTPSPVRESGSAGVINYTSYTVLSYNPMRKNLLNLQKLAHCLILAMRHCVLICSRRSFSRVAYRYVAVLPRGGGLQSIAPRSSASSSWIATEVVVSKTVKLFDFWVIREDGVVVRIAGRPSLAAQSVCCV